MTKSDTKPFNRRAFSRSDGRRERSGASGDGISASRSAGRRGGSGDRHVGGGSHDPRPTFRANRRVGT